MHRHTNTYTNIQTYADKCTQTNMHRQTHRAQNHVYTDKFTQRHRYTRHTQTGTHMEAHKDIQADTYRLTDIQIDPQDMERYKNTQQEHRDIETQTHKYKQTPRHPETKTHQAFHSQWTHIWTYTAQSSRQM